MRFFLDQSDRKCYLGHVDTFGIVGKDAPSADWLGGWDLWCRTCEALVVDSEAVVVKREDAARKGVIGYVLSVPVEMIILGGPEVERDDDEVE